MMSQISQELSRSEKKLYKVTVILDSYYFILYGALKLPIISRLNSEPDKIKPLENALGAINCSILNLY